MRSLRRNALLKRSGRLFVSGRGAYGYAQVLPRCDFVGVVLTSQDMERNPVNALMPAGMLEAVTTSTRLQEAKATAARYNRPKENTPSDASRRHSMVVEDMSVAMQLRTKALSLPHICG